MLWGFAARRSQSVDQPATLALRADDPGAPAVSWRLVFGGERISAEESDEPTDAVVAGPSEQLYRWLWNRPADVEISGDATVAALWRRVRVRWG
jgi:hypothetical protein